MEAHPVRPGGDDVVFRLERPHPNLLPYYFLVSLVLGPLFPVLFVVRFIRYRTLRYRFDEEGVTQRWGVLFRREISLTYSRIQDIHLASNAIERQLGLARVLVQTASGSSSAEMTIEGLQEFEQVRDFLYRRMRGVRAVRPERGPVEVKAVPGAAGGADELAAALLAAAVELAELRKTLQECRGGLPQAAGRQRGDAS